MKLIFSRKGFDSAAGKAPSPIIEGEPISLPIPTTRRSETSYRCAGLGKIVEHMTRGRIGGDDLCHEDPMFSKGRWAFGQTGAAQSHLERNGVGVGDVFFFSACSRHTPAGTAIIGYSGTWKSMRCADLAADLARVIVPKDSCGDIRIPSVNGTRTTRFISALGPRRAVRTLVCVSQSLVLRFQSGTSQHGLKW